VKAALGAALATLALAVPAMAQPKVVDPSVLSNEAAAVLYREVDISPDDLFKASLQVGEKAASVTYAPLLYGLPDYREVLSEWRVKASFKDKELTLGTSLSFNPLSPRGYRGTSLWSSTPEPTGTTPPDLVLRQWLESEAKTVKGLLEGLRNEYTASEGNAPVQAEIAGRIADMQARLLAIAGELEASKTADDDRFATKLNSYQESLLLSWAPVVTVAYNATLFSNFGGVATDADADGLNDVGRTLKKHTWSASAAWRPGLRTSFSGLLAIEREHDQETRSPAAHSVGGNVTFGQIVHVLDPDYRKSDDFKEGLFVPGITAGISFETRHCRSDVNICPDKIQSERAFTPFLDVRVNPKAQFRVGFPITRKKGLEKDAQEISLTTGLTVQLGEPD